MSSDLQLKVGRGAWTTAMRAALPATATFLASIPILAFSFDVGAAPASSEAHVAIFQVTRPLQSDFQMDHATSESQGDTAGNQKAQQQTPIAQDESELVALPGHLISVPEAAVALTAAQPADQHMALTVVLRRDDQAAFERYLKDVYDSASPNYRRFLTQSQLTAQFGPSSSSYASVRSYFKAQGLSVGRASGNRMTLALAGTRSAVERALHLRLRDYKLANATFFAPENEPLIPASIQPHVLNIAGLASAGAPKPVVDIAVADCEAILSVIALGTGYQTATSGLEGAGKFVTGPYLGALSVECLAILAGVKLGNAFDGGGGGGPGGGPNNKPPPCTMPVCLRPWVPKFFGPIGVFWTGLFSGPGTGIGVPGGYGGLPGGVAAPKTFSAASRALSGSRDALPPNAYTSDGIGQIVGLVEFDAFNMSDVSNFLAFAGLSSTQIGMLSVVPVNGGISTPGAAEDEVLLDIDTVMAIAPGAQVAVYEAPFHGQAADYSAVFNAMIDGGVTIISNSWSSCEDQVSQADAMGVDAVLQSAAASGISVFNGTGDSGSTCLDGSPNTIGVPADSPNATAVGGTSLVFGPDNTYAGETWWNGSAATPVTGQGGFGTSRYFATPSYQSSLNAAPGRSVPDLVVDADPESGMIICQADAGGCPTGSLYGGTSMATPLMASLAALINSRLGSNQGFFNPLVYPLAGGNAFNSAASMGSDFSHVGLGSPILGTLTRLLNNVASGTPDATLSQVNQLTDIYATGEILPALPGVPSDGNSKGVISVKLYDANGYPVTGKTVSLAANAGSQATITPVRSTTSVSDGTAIFEFTDLANETLTLTATDTTDNIQLSQTNTIVFVPPVAAAAGISGNPSAVPADGQSTATITITMQDALGRPSPGKLIYLSEGGAHASVTGPSPAVTDSNGQLVFTATDQTNESVTFTATDVTDSNLAIPGSATVIYSGSTSTACGLGVAPVAGTGYSITPYVTGAPAAATLYYGGVNVGCPGANRPAFTSSGAVLVSDFLNGGIYQLGLAGGSASNTTLLSTLSPALGALVYGKDGSLYTTLGDDNAEIVQVSQVTGQVLRVVASGLTCPAGLAVDPLSGDLFFDDQCTGGGADDATVYRITDPANTDASNPTAVVAYATLPATPNGGMAFAPNGTLYAVSGYFGNVNAPVEMISGTNVGSVSVAAVANVTSDYGIAIGATNADGSAQTLIVEPAGQLSNVPIANPSGAMVLATVSPGIGAIGPDGCLYAARNDAVYRLTSAGGGCTFAPTSSAPTITLAPAAQASNPSQGTSVTLTATVSNVTTLSGNSVGFLVGGANTVIRFATTNASGQATITYTGTQSGADKIVATTTFNNVALLSNSAQVNWSAGAHVTFLTLNGSVRGGISGQPVTVTASLTDTTASPTVAVPNQTITLSLGSSSCTASTNASGIASCQLTPASAGLSTLSAGFAGTSGFAASRATAPFNAAPPAAPETVVVAGKIHGGGSFGLWSLVLLGIGLLLRLRSRALGPLMVLMLIAGFSGRVHAQGTVNASEGPYVGVRIGALDVIQSASTMNSGLSAAGFSGVTATSSNQTAVAGEAYAGYALSPWLGFELGYTHRSANLFRLSGSVPTGTDLSTLTSAASRLANGYGDAYSLAWRAHLSWTENLSFDPRLGGFFWNTSDSAEVSGVTSSTTHRGGGVTAGAGVAYRLWRGLELGAGIDYLAGSSSNNGLLYAGTLEWRIGR